MKNLKNEMIEEARRIYGEITPITGKASLEACFTIYSEIRVIMLWFNISNHSTKVIKRSV